MTEGAESRAYDKAAAYEALAQKAAAFILWMLKTSEHARTWDPLRMWEALGGLVPPGLEGVTWLQWSAAHEYAREYLDLPPLPYGTGDIAFVFAMDDSEALARFKELSSKS